MSHLPEVPWYPSNPYTACLLGTSDVCVGAVALECVCVCVCVCAFVCVVRFLAQFERRVNSSHGEYPAAACLIHQRLVFQFKSCSLIFTITGNDKILLL